ncbi:ATP-dependent helicase [Microbacterium sp. No. 7]|uniref:ATP-dependent helicase n=1 Tax=Microbacterium sp. No. 7 TaxID=1714373 RepID=UPI0006CFFFB1|nr:ATP-dependent helicase [Microbacterium sp. No. 7]ALJ19966.1 ATP-dependent DNA helicase [Microbacterium sp. No. 7]
MTGAGAAGREPAATGPLAGLDPQQLEAATAVRGPVCVLAGAGTGKTRVVTRRIAHAVETGAFTPQRVMAVTFTTKAAGEMRGRLRALGVDGVAARTFHAAALAQLNYFWPQVAGDTAPAVLSGKVRLLGQVADEARVRVDGATLRDLAARIERRKVTMLSIEEDAARHPRGLGALDADAVADLQRAYERHKDGRRQLDFEDVLLACAGMIEAEPRVAQAVREQYRHFTVDEFQDISPLQFRLLELWLGARRDLCVVGDPSQTIYSFAGADPAYLLEFTHRYPDAQVVRLERNYRSDAAVLAVANTLMRGRPGALELRGDAPPGPKPRLRGYPDERAEAEGVAALVAAQLAAGARPAEVAVLYRANAQSALLLSALAARGIAAKVLGGARFFDLPEVRQAVLALRGAAVAPTTAPLAQAVRDILRSLGLTDEPPAADGALREGWEARATLLRLAEQAPEDMTMRAFADDLQARARDQHEPTMETVTLATLHAAKGLEWPHVHLVGLAEGLLPIGYATTFEQVDEERRLAYVGITRAARTLSLSWADGARGPSRFLQEIGTDTLDAGGARTSGGARSSR